MARSARSIALLPLALLFGVASCTDAAGPFAGFGDRKPNGKPRPSTPGSTAAQDAAAQAPAGPAAFGAAQSEVLMVDDATLTIGEVLYDLREELHAARKLQTRSGFSDAAERLIRRHTQQEVGSLLLYGKAGRTLTTQQNEAVDKFAKEDLQRQVSRDYGGSTARLEQELAQWGVTLEQYKATHRRRLVVRQYARETMLPRAGVRRDELLSYYQEHIQEFTKSELRELLMIAAPFPKFVPEGTNWKSATNAMRAQARLAAQRQIDAARTALATRPFEDVAREFGRDAASATGGSWGLIGKPLQPPLDAPSKRLFTLSEGEISETVETEGGFYIVKCGRIEAETRTAFNDCQDQLRRALMDRKFNEAIGDYVTKLADKATISSMEDFARAALKRAETVFPPTGPAAPSAGLPLPPGAATIPLR